MIICSIQRFSTGSNGVQTYDLRDPKTNFMFTHESNKELIRLESVVARYCVPLGKRFDGLDLGENAHEKLSLSIDPCPKKHVRLHLPQVSLKPLCFTVRCLTQHCWRVRSQTYLSIQTTETTQTTQWLSNSETTQGSQTTQRFSNLTIQTTQGSQTTQTTQTTQTILTIQTIQTITSAISTYYCY